MTTEIKIDHNIPMPREAGGRSSKYPWRGMEIGDSFFIAGKKTNRFSSTWEAGRRTGKKFIARAVEGGIRVWRTA